MAGRDPISTQSTSVRPDSENDENESEETVATQFRGLEKEPTKEEIEEHNIDHSNFRS